MKRFTKIALFIALGFFVVGIILFTAAAAKEDFNWKNIFGWQKLHERSESFTGVVTRVEVQEESADVRFVRHDKNEVVVVMTETETDAHGITIQNGVLTVQAASRRSEFWDHFRFFRPKTAVTVYLPADSCPSVTVKTASGDIRMEKGLGFQSFEAESRSGDMVIDSVVHGAASVKTTSGDVKWNARVSGGNLTIETTSGDLSLSGSFSGQVKVTTTSGDQSFSHLTVQGFLTVHSTSGDVRIEDSDLSDSAFVNTTSGDLTALNVVSNARFSVVTTSGDQTFTLCDAERFELESRSGDVEMILPSRRICSVYSSSGRISVPDSLTRPDPAGKTCVIRTESGDVTLSVHE